MPAPRPWKAELVDQIEFLDGRTMALLSLLSVLLAGLDSGAKETLSKWAKGLLDEPFLASDHPEAKRGHVATLQHLRGYLGPGTMSVEQMEKRLRREGTWPDDD